MHFSLKWKTIYIYIGWQINKKQTSLSYVSFRTVICKKLYYTLGFKSFNLLTRDYVFHKYIRMHGLSLTEKSLKSLSFMMYIFDKCSKCNIYKLSKRALLVSKAGRLRLVCLNTDKAFLYTRFVNITCIMHIARFLFPPDSFYML